MKLETYLQSPIISFLDIICKLTVFPDTFIGISPLFFYKKRTIFSKFKLNPHTCDWLSVVAILPIDPGWNTISITC